MLKLLSHKSWESDCKLLLRLFSMLIEPKIDYGNEAYSFISNTEPSHPNSNGCIQELTCEKPLCSFWSQASRKLEKLNYLTLLREYSPFSEIHCMIDCRPSSRRITMRKSSSITPSYQELPLAFRNTD